MSFSETGFWIAALLGHGSLWVEVVNRTHALGWRRSVVDAVTVGCGLAVFGLPIAVAVHLATRPSPGQTAAWATWYGVLALVAGVVYLTTRILLRWDPRRDRRVSVTETELIDTHVGLPAGALSPRLAQLAGLPGNQVLRVSVEHLTLPLKRLPSAAEGLKIAHLTDLHMSGRLPIEYFQRVVERVNAWEPDIVCVTGDIVEHAPQLEWVAPTLGRLSARCGAFFILGNHDEKVDCDDLRARLAQAGYTDAASGVHRIAVNGASLTVCGDERPWFTSATEPNGDEAFTLCLAHTPDRFGWAIRSGVDLLLAGHNHGGQVCFPLFGPLLCPSRHGVRYAAGTFRAGRTVMHAGRGTGSLFPLRYNCPPEVALITLTTEGSR